MTDGTVRPSSATAPKKRRGHAAQGGRILALGLSAGAAVAFTAAMANAVTPTTGAAVASPQPAQIVVHVVMANGQTTDTALTSAPVVTAAPVATRAIAKSRAS